MPGPLPETPAWAVCLLSVLLVPLAMAGLALINNGLGRSRSAAHAMLASLCVTSVAFIVYVVCGFSWAGFAGGPAHVFTLGGKPWNWIAAQPSSWAGFAGGPAHVFTLGGKPWNWIAPQPFFLRGVELDGSPASLALLLQMF